MSSCSLRVEFDDSRRSYEPGQEIRGRVVVMVDKDVTCKKLEITQVWKTHGRGNAQMRCLDRALHASPEWSAGRQYAYPFSFRAPAMPLTYHGNLLNVDHYVDATADIPWARDPRASEDYVLTPGPNSHRDYLATPPDFTKQGTEPASGCARALGWILLPLIIVLLVGLAVFILPIALIVLVVGYVRRRAAESKLGPVDVTLNAPLLPEPADTTSKAHRVAAAFTSGSKRKRAGKHVIIPGQVVQFTIAFTPPGALEITRISARVGAEESVRAGSGTDAKTFTHQIWQQDLELSGSMSPPAGMPVRRTVEVAFPDVPAYSFEITDNKLSWTMSVRVDIPHWPDWVRDVAIVMIPRD
ncbi:MAG: hypothetical protein HYV63_32960 [Candidatus Schekmanbacteria bacterium]|nr:hypothetical protein [Candidatus Schekmanbacteria bacterium]